MKRICVYAGARNGADPRYAGATRALADALAVRGLGLVYGGGRLGLMGELARAAVARGVSVTGVIPTALHHHELAWTELDDLIVVNTMHERQMLMAELADAFIALPGGLGTLAEVVEVLSWTQLGLHRKPVGVLDIAGYWAGLDALLAHAAREGFVGDGARPISASDPDELLDGLATWHAPRTDPRVRMGARGA